MFKVVLDLDGVIAIPRPDNRYELCEVVTGAIEELELICEYAEVTIHTARWEEDRGVTEKWLADKKVPYHKLILGKPLADVYVDDRGMHFADWKKTQEGLQWERILKDRRELLMR